MKIFTLLKRMLKTAPVDVKVWKMWEHTGWGNTIAWFSYPDRITGHLPVDLIGFRPLKEGDEVQCHMKSGKDLRVRVLRVEWMLDPSDQFFADVEPIGYIKGG